ncbi:hypothetical protein AAFF_G00329860 [Aldrovandia affinis]|uniref:Uncharacterized protein n=1 Tax=Aldrovandia affinis TaxID=143900 RepID=A0AAD7SLZ6_9TELE|nr:hypothetical protein AAFF_G00329860 [Aldrovandia affinis]
MRLLVTKREYGGKSALSPVEGQPDPAVTGPPTAMDERLGCPLTHLSLHGDRIVKPVPRRYRYAIDTEGRAGGGADKIPPLINHLQCRCLFEHKKTGMLLCPYVLVFYTLTGLMHG